MSQNGRKNGDVSKEQSRTTYVRHVIHGESPESIAEERSISTADVLREIERIESSLAAEYIDEFQRIRARHTVRLEAIFLQAMAGYERSCEDEVVQKRTAQGDPAAESVDGPRGRGTVQHPKLRVETTTKRKAGNARYLWEARGALSDIRRMWGFNAGSSVKEMNSQNVPSDVSDRALAAASDADLISLQIAGDIMARLAAQRSAGKQPLGTEDDLFAAPERFDVPEY